MVAIKSLDLREKIEPHPSLVRHFLLVKTNSTWWFFSIIFKISNLWLSNVTFKSDQKMTNSFLNRFTAPSLFILAKRSSSFGIDAFIVKETCFFTTLGCNHIIIGIWVGKKTYSAIYIYTMKFHLKDKQRHLQFDTLNCNHF